MFWHDSHPMFMTLSQQDALPLEVGAIDPYESPSPVPGTFDDFAQKAATSRGVVIEDLEAGTTLTVRTSHSCYRFEIVDPAAQRARVTGGSLFPEPTDVRVDGATVGGCMIKAGWVGIGLRMEFTSGRRRITTSRVKFLSLGDSPLEAPAA
jgi:hypothetical protein